MKHFLKVEFSGAWVQCFEFSKEGNIEGTGQKIGNFGRKHAIFWDFVQGKKVRRDMESDLLMANLQSGTLHNSM